MTMIMTTTRMTITTMTTTTITTIFVNDLTTFEAQITQFSVSKDSS